MARTSKASGAKKTAKTVKSAGEKASKTVAAKAAPVKKAPTSSRKSTAAASVLNPNRLLAELVGVFVLTLAVIAALSGKFALSFFFTPDQAAQIAQTGQPVPSFGLYPFVAGLALIVVVLATYRISGGHLNPAVTIGRMVLKLQSIKEGLGYIIAQILGAMLALSVATQLVKVTDQTTGQLTALEPSNLFSQAASWEIFFAEVLGAFVFGFAVAAAFTYRALPRAVAYGGAFILGLAVALMAGAGVLNPALAVGVGLIGVGGENVLALAGIYLGGSTLGVLVGMAFHHLLNRDLKEVK